MSHQQAREHLLAGLTGTDWEGRPPNSPRARRRDGGLDIH